MEPTTTSQTSGELDGGAQGGREAAKRRHTSSTLVVVGIAALAIGALSGFVIGWRFEQNRAKSDIANTRPVGVVTAVTDDSLTVRLRTASGTRVYELTDTTVIDRASSGDTADLEEGATVLVRPRRGPGGALEASEVIVLPDTSSWVTR